MADYPDTLPPPDKVNYSGVTDNGIVRTTISSPQGNQRATFNAPRTEISLQFSMDNSKYLEWLTWVEANGWKWFSMELVTPSSPVKVTSTQYRRFMSPIQYTKNGDNWLTVTVIAELMQAQAVDPLAPDNPIQDDPYQEYAELIRSLDVQPITWVRGPNGVENEGTGLPASWLDYNRQPEPVADSRGLTTLGGIDVDAVGRELVLGPSGNSTWSLNAATWAYSGGRDPQPGSDDVFIAAGVANNVGIWSASLQCPEFPPNGSVPSMVGGWPSQWFMQATNIYNNDLAGTGTVDPATCLYRVRVNNVGGAILFDETVAAPGIGPSVDIDSRSGTITSPSISFYLFMQVITEYSSVVDPPDVTVDFTFSVKTILPKMGYLGPHELTDNGPHTITLIYQHTTSHPYGIPIQQEQWLMYAGEMALIVDEGGVLSWVKRSQAGQQYTIPGTFIENEWYAITIRQEVNANYTNSVWVNGIKEFELIDTVGATVSTDSGLYTGGFFRGESDNPNDHGSYRRPVINGIAEYTMFDYALTDQQIIDQHNALLA